MTGRLCMITVSHDEAKALYPAGGRGCRGVYTAVPSAGDASLAFFFETFVYTEDICALMGLFYTFFFLLLKEWSNILGNALICL